MGCYDDYIKENLKELDVLLLESNHDLRMLQAGRKRTGMKRALITGGVASSALYRRLLTERCAALREAPELSASWYESVDAFLAQKDSELQDGDSVLVKASHFMQFSRIVEELAG